MRAVGIDISASGIRIAEVEPKLRDQFVTVKKLAFEPFPPDSSPVYPGGTIAYPVAVADALARALKAAKIPPRKIVVPVRSGVGTALHSVPVGLKNAAEYEAAIRGLADIPLWHEEGFERTTARLSWKVVNQHVTGAGVRKELLAITAVRRESVEQIEEVLELARVEPLAIDTQPACLLRALVRTHPDDDEVVTIVDVGASSTSVLTRRGPYPRHFVVIPSGGRKLTEAVQQNLGLSFADADTQKRYMRLEAPDLDSTIYGFGSSAAPSNYTQLDRDLSSAADDIIEEIAVAIEADASSNPANPTTGIQLVGLASRMSGFRQRLESRTGLPVHYGQPWVSMASAKVAEKLVGDDPFEQRRLIMSFSTAIGAALWPLTTRPSVDNN